MHRLAASPTERLCRNTACRIPFFDRALSCLLAPKQAHLTAICTKILRPFHPPRALALGLAVVLLVVCPCLASAQKNEPPRKTKKKGLFEQTLNQKNLRRVLKHCDDSHVTFFLSAPGRFTNMEETTSFRRTAKYVAHKILATQLEALHPDFLDRWRETGFWIRKKTAHHGEVGPGDNQGHRTFDFDGGVRSGKPFIGGKTRSSRFTLEYDPRRGRTRLSWTREFGSVEGRIELRAGDKREIRFHISIPASH